MTRATTDDQKRPSPPVVRPSPGMRRAFTRSPRRLRTAGRSVSAAATATRATRIAPRARLRRIVSGTSTIPLIARTNAMPLNSTARLDVAPAAAIASTFSRPPARSSR